MRWRLPAAMATAVAVPLGWLALAAWLADSAGIVPRDPQVGRGLALGLLVSGVVAIGAAATAGWTVARRLTRLQVAARSLTGLGTHPRARGANPALAELRATGPRELAEAARSLSDTVEVLEARLLGLRSERDRLDAVLESMTEGVVVVDTAGRIQLVNPAFSRVAGRLPEYDPRGRTLLAVVRSEAVDAAAREALAGRPVLFRETELPGRPPRTLVVTASPFHTLHDEDTVEGAVLVIRDVTERRRLQTVRQDFVANVSHELKTPLAAIRGYTETLLDGGLEDPEAAGPFLRTIHDHALRMNALVDDLLDLAALDAGAYPLETGPIRLPSVLERAVAHVRAAAEAKQVDVQVACGPMPEVRADPGALGQVLVNLLDNAIKYGPSQSSVRLDAHAVGDTVRIEVADRGPGIPEQARTRIFERFYRVDPGRSRSVGGTGLGLSIVRHLVQQMGGTVSVSCPPEGGAVFRVDLPLTSSNERPANEQHS